MIQAGILGATGYAGVELTRLLLRHPGAQVAAVGSVSFEGQALWEVYHIKLSSEDGGIKRV